MKNFAKIGAMLAILGISFSACNNKTISPSSNITTQERNVTDFDGIEVSAAFIVDIEFSATEERVEIETNENLQQYIEVVKSGSNLIIRIIRGTSISGNATFKAHIITPNPMIYMAASGSSLITLNNKLETTDLTFSLSGASNLTGNIDASTMTVFLDGASNATITGTVETLGATMSGASLLRDFGLSINDANLQLDGASQSSLTINGSIDLIAAGASSLAYKGNPTLGFIELTGGSQIIDAN